MVKKKNRRKSQVSSPPEWDSDEEYAPQIASPSMGKRKGPQQQLSPQEFIASKKAAELEEMVRRKSSQSPNKQAAIPADVSIAGGDLPQEEKSDLEQGKGGRKIIRKVVRKSRIIRKKKDASDEDSSPPPPPPAMEMHKQPSASSVPVYMDDQGISFRGEVDDMDDEDIPDEIPAFLVEEDRRAREASAARREVMEQKKEASKKRKKHIRKKSDVAVNIGEDDSDLEVSVDASGIPGEEDDVGHRRRVSKADMARRSKEVAHARKMDHVVEKFEKDEPEPITNPGAAAIAILIVQFGILVYVCNESNFKFASFEENFCYAPVVEAYILNIVAISTYQVVDDGKIYLLLTTLMVHAGYIAFILEALILVFIGRRIEMAFGSVKFVLIWLLSGLSGAAASIGLDDQTISVGGGIPAMGLLGATVADLILNREYFNYGLPFTVVTVIFGVVLSVLLGMTPLVNGLALPYAFITGLFAGFAFMASSNIEEPKNQGPGVKPPRRKPLPASGGRTTCRAVSFVLMFVWVIMLVSWPFIGSTGTIDFTYDIVEPIFGCQTTFYDYACEMACYDGNSTSACWSLLEAGVDIQIPQ